MTILIKNGRIITDHEDYTADIFIENGKIRTIFAKINSRADTIIDASDKFVIPGGIDAHTHLDMPLANTFSSDNFESGTIAAAHGGTTTNIDFPTQKHGTKPQEALQEWLAPEGDDEEGAIVSEPAVAFDSDVKKSNYSLDTTATSVKKSKAAQFDDLFNDDKGKTDDLPF